MNCQGITSICAGCFFWWWNACSFGI